MENFNKEKIIYLVRHGQSEGNISRTYQRIDSPLSEEGKQQASTVADRIAKISFDVLISSPLPRAKETAEAIADKTHKIPEYDDLFVERIKPTRLNGKSQDDEDARNLAKEWRKSLHTSGYRAEDGENFDDIIIRADEALEFLSQRTEKVIVVVTHGYFLRTILTRVLFGSSLTEDDYKSFASRTVTENTGISAIRYNPDDKENAWHLWIYNDHAHLG